jgi:hypothetical protein
LRPVMNKLRYENMKFNSLNHSKLCEHAIQTGISVCQWLAARFNLLYNFYRALTPFAELFYFRCYILYIPPAHGIA